MNIIAIGTESNTHDFIKDNNKTTDMQSSISIASDNSDNKQEWDANSNYSDSGLSSYQMTMTIQSSLTLTMILTKENTRRPIHPFMDRTIL